MIKLIKLALRPDYTGVWHKTATPQVLAKKTSVEERTEDSYQIDDRIEKCLPRKRSNEILAMHYSECECCYV